MVTEERDTEPAPLNAPGDWTPGRAVWILMVVNSLGLGFGIVNIFDLGGEDFGGRFLLGTGIGIAFPQKQTGPRTPCRA